MFLSGYLEVSEVRVISEDLRGFHEVSGDFRVVLGGLRVFQGVSREIWGGLGGFRKYPYISGGLGILTGFQAGSNWSLGRLILKRPFVRYNPACWNAFWF